MRSRTTRTPLRLPSKLAYTALGVAVVGTLACSAQSNAKGDASTDASDEIVTADAADALADTDDEAQGTDGTVDAMPPDAPTDTPTDALADGDGCAAIFQCVAVVDGAVCPIATCAYDECRTDAGCEPFV